MKLITFKDIAALSLPPETCYQWASETIRQKGEMMLPPKTSIKPRDGVFCTVMPSILPDDTFGRIGGMKIVTRYPERTPSLDSKLLLFNAENGTFLALMDANWITAMRTGAVAAHSILLFAKRSFSTVSFMGLGNTARAALLILANQLPDRSLTVRLKAYKGQERSFAERFREYPRLHFETVDTYEQLVRGSDVIVSAVTYLSENVCPDEYFDEGVLLVPIHTRGFGNCDLFFDKVFADDYGHVCRFKYFDRFRSFAEVGDVVNGKAVGRENDRERILAYNVGVSIHDVRFAANIYKLLLKSRADLPEISLEEPEEKFWV